MVDVELSNPDGLSSILKKFRKIRKNIKDDGDIKGLRDGSIVDMLLQNNPMTDMILYKSDLGLLDYQILSQDFNFKSQMIRCFEIKANNSQKVIFENIFKINEKGYAPLIEHDLIQIMMKTKVAYIQPFFELTNKEELVEQENDDVSIFCNFEQ